MTGSRLLIGVASVLAGTTVILVVFGLVYNLVLLVAAVPFAAATYLIWSHATGRLDARMRERARRQQAPEPGPTGGVRGRQRAPRERRPSGQSTAGRRERRARETRHATTVGDGPSLSRSAAARVLGVRPDADDAAVRRAFREKAKELHPDAPGGDEAAFRRARAAYEQLTGRG